MREVRVGAEGRTALEGGCVVAVEHRLNAQLSMRAAGVGQLSASKCLIADLTLSGSLLQRSLDGKRVGERP